MDCQTLEVARDKYARICVEVDLKKLLIPFIWVKKDLQAIEYKGLDEICFDCSHHGHIAAAYHMNSYVGGVKGTEKGPEAGGDHRKEVWAVPEARPYGPWMLAKQRKRKVDCKTQSTRAKDRGRPKSYHVSGPIRDAQETEMENDAP